MFKLGHRSMERLEGVHPELIIVLKEAIKHTPIDFGIAPDGGVRTAQRQNELYCNPKIKTHADGYERLSAHQIKRGKRYGEAVDIICYLHSSLTWHEVHFAIVGGVILSTASTLKRQGIISIELLWGATFGSRAYLGWDAGHFEIREKV